MMRCPRCGARTRHLFRLAGRLVCRRCVLREMKINPPAVYERATG